MGSTKKAITQVYYNNSTTPTTVNQTVESEIMVDVTSISSATGVITPKEIARQDKVYPGVIGGTKANI